jgi:hypothetical protein
VCVASKVSALAACVAEAVPRLAASKEPQKTGEKERVYE